MGDIIGGNEGRKSPGGEGRRKEKGLTRRKSLLGKKLTSLMGSREDNHNIVTNYHHSNNHLPNTPAANSPLIAHKSSPLERRGKGGKGGGGVEYEEGMKLGEVPEGEVAKVGNFPVWRPEADSFTGIASFVLTQSGNYVYIIMIV